MMQTELKKGRRTQCSLPRRYLQNWELVLMLLPGLVCLIIFHYMPMYGVLIAFKDFKFLKGIWGSDWVGFDHFVKLFSGMDFANVLRNTVVISVLKLVCGAPAPILLALLLNEVRNSGYKRIVQTLSYLPHFFSWVVLGGIIGMVFSTQGPVNMILGVFGLKEPLGFYSDGGLFLGLLIGTAVWQSVGWSAVIYIATLSGIDETLYEAACIDGAGRFKQAIYISLPSLLPTFITVQLLNLGNILNAGFDQVYNMFNTTVYDVADIIDTYALRKLQTMDYGLGAAVGLFKSAIGLMLVLSFNKITKSLSGGEMGIL